MMRRRTVFATPFVIVLGCGAPREHGPTEATRASVRRSDDAAIADASQVAVELPPPNKCLDPKRPGYNRCNPPEPDARLPVVVEGDVMRVEQRDGAAYAYVRLERWEQVRSGWRAEFIDANAKALGECKIVNIQSRNVVCKISNGNDAPSKKVRVSEVELPPPNPAAPDAHVPVIVEGDVMRQETSEGNTFAFVSLEREAGVRKTWTAQFIDQSGAVKGSCVIVNVQKRNVTCRVVDAKDAPSRRLRITETGQQ